MDELKEGVKALGIPDYEPVGDPKVEGKVEGVFFMQKKQATPSNSPKWLFMVL